MWRLIFVACVASGLFLFSTTARAQQWQTVDCATSKVSIAGMKTCWKGPDDAGAVGHCHTEQYSAAYGWASAQQAAAVWAYVVDRTNSGCYTAVVNDDQLNDILRKLVQSGGKVEGKNFSPIQAVGSARGMHVDWPSRKCFVFHLNGPTVMGTGGGAGFANWVRGYVCGPTSGTPLTDDDIVKFLSTVQVKQ